MISRTTGKPMRALWRCRYCNRKIDTGATSRPVQGFCDKRPKVGSRMQPHMWVIEKRY